ncbi:MAG: TauD/TfdA family dioxygenase [Pseudomonadota bacterium]
MTFPHLVTNNADIRDSDSLLAWLQPQIAELKSHLDDCGTVLFRGFPIHCAEDFDRFSAAFGYGDFTYQESLSNAIRINFTPRVFTANEAPPEVEIYLHHEMAQTPIAPEKIFFCCLNAAEYGGATPLCRSDKFYEAFKSQYPEWAEQFAELGLKYTTHMPYDADEDSGQGRSWRSTLSVDAVADAEEKLSTLGYSWQWQSDQSLLATTPALPAVRKLPNGSESFFNQVIAAYRGWKRVDSSPDAILTFGNGDSIPVAALEAIASLADDFTFPVEWQDGDIALVDNHRIMHGRKPYSGDRKRQVLVSLARERH